MTEKKISRLKFGHIFLAAAVLMVLVHFIIAGFPIFAVVRAARILETGESCG